MSTIGPRWFRRRRPWLLAGAALVAVLGVGELVARLVLGLGNPVLYVAHPTIEYMMRPDQDVRRFGRHILVNQYGMRSPPFSAHKQDAHELRILVMGDSVVNGGALTDQSMLATSILSENLARSMERPVIVGNVSAGSWGPQNLLAWSRVFGFLDADYVVIVLSSHDASDIPTFAPLDPSEQPTRTPISALIEGMTRYLPAYLLRFTAPDSTAPQLSDDFKAARAEALDAARDLMRDAQAAGRCVSMIQHLTVNEITAAPGPGYDALGSIAAQLGISHRSDGPEMTAARARNENPFRDNIHPNDAGQEILAQLLLQAVQQCTPPR